MKIFNNYIKLLNIILVLFFVFCFFYFDNQVKIINQRKEGQIVSQSNIDKTLNNLNMNPTINKAALDAYAQSDNTNEEILFRVETELGIDMISTTKQWNEEKLLELYDELLKNKHGDEINSLYQIWVYGNSSPTALGTHIRESKNFEFYFDFPALNPNAKILYPQDIGIITLYDGDTNTSVKSMANTLSHEYGHHYTFTYMFNNKEGYQKYAQLRGLSSQAILDNELNDETYYIKNHHWYLIEIAADDYVQLMGSANAKNVVNYIDIEKALVQKIDRNFNESYNAIPQENMMIPLAYEIDGLQEYYYEFINSNQYSYFPADYVAINLEIEKQVRSYQSSTGELRFDNFKITWNNAYPNLDVTYTLIGYDENNYYIYPIKTVKSNQDCYAYVGTYSFQGTEYIHWLQDEFDEGKKTFVVTALFPNGTIRKSNPLVVQFKEGNNE